MINTFYLVLMCIAFWTGLMKSWYTWFPFNLESVARCKWWKRNYFWIVKIKRTLKIHLENFPWLLFLLLLKYQPNSIVTQCKYVTVRELNSQLYNRIEYKKGSHCSRPCTLALTDILCSPYVHAFSLATQLLEQSSSCRIEWNRIK